MIISFKGRALGGLMILCKNDLKLNIEIAKTLLNFSNAQINRCAYKNHSQNHLIFKIDWGEFAILL